MSEKLTLQEFQRLMRMDREREIKPRVILTKDEADQMNDADKQLGLPHEWTVGSIYYVIQKYEE